MKIIKKIFIGLLTFVLFGCVHHGAEVISQPTNAVNSGVGDGVVANRVLYDDGKTAGALGGAVLCSILGSADDESMDSQDQLSIEDALINNPVGKESTWINQKSGATYTIRPVREYRSDNGRCREAITTINVNGSERRAFTTVCRRNNSWYLLQ